MTTLRHHLEQGTLTGPIYEYYLQHKGQIPLCCFENKLQNGKWMITCRWLMTWMTMKEFRKKCKQCQKEMEDILNARSNC